MLFYKIDIKITFLSHFYIFHCGLLHTNMKLLHEIFQVVIRKCGDQEQLKMPDFLFVMNNLHTSVLHKKSGLNSHKMHYEKKEVILHQKSKIENKLYIAYARIRNSPDKE